MGEAVYRLGDLIDDFCPRCRLLLNHRVASMVGDAVAKVICQTCYTEHPYRHGEGAKKKPLPSSRSVIFDQVLSKVQAPASSPTPVADPPEASKSAARKKKKGPAVLTRYISRHKSKPKKR